ncbi:TetR-like C-terminal domain-containing protein [Faecalicatena orotica]|uniref:AcrR family transcriptional regulator n=1 Tax=Faecalicatena orotica TaxID=1544 RepID=A0A2Y9BF29_9FIRM|nr:TetR-like C-terminal domain-containing protein [Faecalicatena orotica]PWJ32345.1 AcrR family transcriptional regulator [Faecalicatena orotica]SSA54179.1 DNA-binding transcriptional regulator, AcrR family [Faecalicatena orotica]
MKNTNCKTKIRDTFWDLLSTKDINQIHVKEITEILGINRSTFYLYYDSIYDILQEIEDNFFVQTVSSVKLFVRFPLEDRYFTFPHPGIIDFLEFCRKNKKLIKVLLIDRKDPKFINEYEQHIKETFCQKAVKEHYISSDIDPRFQNAYFKQMIDGHLSFVRWWIENDDDMPDEQTALLVYRLMYAPFRYIKP